MNVFGHSVSFWKTIFQFLWKNIFDPGNLPNSGSKSSKSISSIFACKIDLKWCIFVTYAKITIYFGRNCWKCSENPHISQIKRKNISRISREIQAKISRETGREFSGISREFPGGNSRDGNPTLESYRDHIRYLLLASLAPNPFSTRTRVAMKTSISQ